MNPRWRGLPPSAHARPGAGVEKLEDRPGKKVGLQVASTVDQSLRLLLTKRHVPQGKIAFINVREMDCLSTLQQGRVDAVTTWEPYGELLLMRIPGAKQATIQRDVTGPGLNGFPEALFQEVRYDGIRVTYVMPGSVATGSRDPARKGWARSRTSRLEIRPAQPKKS